MDDLRRFIASLGDMPPLWPVLAGLVLAGLIARRVPVLRVALSLVTWIALAAVLVAVVGQRERFDPYVAALTGLLHGDKQTVVGTETRIAMARDGHFWARVRVDGVERRMLVDSGATITALSIATARAAGLQVERSVFPLLLRTANGTIDAQTATVDDLRLGGVRARDVAVVVSPAFGDTDVLGMNVLSRLKSWRVEDGTLILVPHHPQPAG
jgi:aspartyl protease family protein